jgi:uncharacterized protein YqiB (DUF1249 family)
MIYRTIFTKLQKLGIIDSQGRRLFREHVKIVHKPFMDLSIDYLEPCENGAYKISIAHNFVQNGDLMADPDMEIRIFPAPLNGAEALTYQLGSLGVYQVVYPEPGKYYPKVRKQLNTFLNGWLSNLIDQGFYLPQKPEDVPAPIAQVPAVGAGQA